MGEQAAGDKPLLPRCGVLRASTRPSSRGSSLALRCIRSPAPTPERRNRSILFRRAGGRLRSDLAPASTTRGRHPQSTPQLRRPSSPTASRSTGRRRPAETPRLILLATTVAPATANVASKSVIRNVGSCRTLCRFAVNVAIAPRRPRSRADAPPGGLRCCGQGRCRPAVRCTTRTARPTPTEGSGNARYPALPRGRAAANRHVMI
jgi:hypothetical protein